MDSPICFQRRASRAANAARILVEKEILALG